MSSYFLSSSSRSFPLSSVFVLISLSAFSMVFTRWYFSSLILGYFHIDSLFHNTLVINSIISYSLFLYFTTELHIGIFFYFHYVISGSLSSLFFSLVFIITYYPCHYFSLSLLLLNCYLSLSAIIIFSRSLRSFLSSYGSLSSFFSSSSPEIIRTILSFLH